MGRKKSYACKQCGTKMELVEGDVLSCPNCGFSIELEDYDTYGWEDQFEEIYFKSAYDVPDVCEACGGPYPDCVIGCNLLEKD